ncbi:MAG: cell division protein FtsI, partial [Clostridiales bacterium]|nr:cell division protein FtsI [Clostridiales bacterium]
MSKKLVGLFIAVILALVGLTARITYINATSGEQYKRIVLSQTQQQYESRIIPFQRGDILDRNGTILATSEKVYNVILDCKVVNDVSKNKEGQDVQRYLEPTVKALVNVLNLDERDIRKRLEDEKTRNSQYQVLQSSLSITDKKKFEAYLA